MRVLEYSRIQFPRYAVCGDMQAQQEDGRDMYPPSAKWLGERTIAAIATVPDRDDLRYSNEKRRNNWWGEYHHAVVETFPLRPIIPPGRPLEFLQAERISHDYLWDDQALPGHSMEIVVHQWDYDRRETTEVAALMLHGVSRYRHQARQQWLIVKDGEAWDAAPDPDVADARRDFYLGAISRLITADSRQPAATTGMAMMIPSSAGRAI